MMKYDLFIRNGYLNQSGLSGEFESGAKVLAAGGVTSIQ
jgi:hypothetical protein